VSDERDIVERLRAENRRLAMLNEAKEAESAAILDWIEQRATLAERASAWCAAMDASGPIRQAYFDRRSAEREVQP